MLTQPKYAYLNICLAKTKRIRNKYSFLPSQKKFDPEKQEQLPN